MPKACCRQFRYLLCNSCTLFGGEVLRLLVNRKMVLLLLIAACGRSQFVGHTSPNEAEAIADGDMMVQATATALIEVGLEDIANPTQDGAREMTIGDPQRSTSINVTAQRAPPPKHSITKAVRANSIF